MSTGEASGGGLGQSGAVQVGLKPVLGFGQFGKNNFFGRNTAQLSSEAEFGQRPDQPLCRVDLPRLYAVAVVMLKFVMIIMVPFAQGHDRHEPPVHGLRNILNYPMLETNSCEQLGFSSALIKL